MIITFYSYKGGVGRSMALANVADLLSRSGLRVMIVDFDLEAPGLEHFFPIDHDQVQSHKGLLDLLLTFKYSMSTESSGTEERNAFRQLDDFLTTVYPSRDGAGGIDLLPAGRRHTDEQIGRYGEELRRFDWLDFYFSWSGELFFEWLRKTFRKRYDAILVDSRTGVTEMGGICAYQLADVIVVFCAPNLQNVEGTEAMVRHFLSPQVRAVRGDRPVEVLIVPARVDQENTTLRATFEQRFEERFSSYLPAALADQDLKFWDLQIPYEPRYAFEERVITDPSRAEERRGLAASYAKLLEGIVLLAPEQSALATLRPAPSGTDEARRTRGPVETRYDPTGRFAPPDVFISFAHGSQEQAQSIQELFSREKLTVATSPDPRAQDAPYTRAASDLARAAKVGLVLVGPEDDQPKWRQREIDQLLTPPGQRSVYVVLLPGASRDQVPPSLFDAPVVDISSPDVGLDSLLATVRTSGGPRGTISAPPPAVERNPYPGMAPFRELDQDVFFGRKAEVDRMLDLLRANRACSVVGPAGIGKTSVVFAGLVPALRRGRMPASERWPVVSVQPGDQALAALVEALTKLKPGSRFSAADASVAVAILRQDFQRIVLVIDQFEELFTRTRESEQQQFIRYLNDLCTTDRGSVLPIAVIRSDLVRELARAPALAELLGVSDPVLIGPLSDDKLRAAIEIPARRSGVTFEPGLVDRLLADVANEPGALTLLQFVLHELWLHQKDGYLTHAAYEQAGGAVHALANGADATLSTLSPDGQEIARRVWLRLVESAKDEIRPREPVEIGELTSGFETQGAGSDQVRAVVERFIDQRLLVTSQTPGQPLKVAMTSEALISAWPTLQHWIADCRDELRARSRLDDAVREWVALSRDAATLLPRDRVEQLVLKMGNTPLSALEREYVAATRQYSQAKPSYGSTRWRVFISHTSELRNSPEQASYVAAVERAISAAGHVIVDMADFGAVGQVPARVCADRVRGCDVYVGLLGTQYGSPVRDRPEVSYSELEFDTATEAGLDRLMFLLDMDTADLGIPLSALIDHEFGARQDAFRRRVRASSLVTQSFTSPAQLGQMVELALRELANTRRRIGSGLQREQVPAMPEPVGGSRFVNPPPVTVPAWFADRQVETALLAKYLTDPGTRMVTVVGRGGIGKTALVCRLLKSLEAGRIPDMTGDLAHVTVGGIVYLSSNGVHRVEYPTLVADLLRLLPTDEALRLQRMYEESHRTPEEMMLALLEALPTGDPVVVLLDSLDSVMDTQREALVEPALHAALSAVLTAPAHAVTVIVTTRVMPTALVRIESANQRQLRLEHGLGTPDAQNMLRQLDDDGHLGLRNAPDELLDALRQHTRGFPRALEAVKAILEADASLTSLDLLDSTRDLPEDMVVEVLVGEAYQRLDVPAQQVMQALSVFPAPVSAVAVDFLLRPVNATTDAAPILSRLVRRQLLRFQDGQYYMNPADRDYACSQLAPGRPDDSPAAFTLASLRARAADYYAQIRTPRESWRALEDVRPQLAEFELRCDAGDYDTAAVVLQDIETDVQMWGHYRTLIHLHERIHGHIADPALNANHLANLGNCHASLGDYRQAIDLLTQALAIFRDIGDRFGEAVQLNNLGLCHASLGDYRQAIDLHTQALAISRDIGDRLGEGNELGNLGLCHASLGDYRQAIDLLTQALAISRDIGDRFGEGNELGNLGLCHASLGDYRQAIDLLTQALAISRDIGNRKGEGSRMCHLGSCQASLGDYRQAIDLLTQALAISRDIGDRYGEAVTLDHLGRACLTSGETQRAVTLLEQAVGIADTTGAIEPGVGARSGLARAHLHLGNPAAALALMAARRVLPYPVEEPAMRLLEGLALLELQRVDESTRALSGAITAADSLLALADGNVAALHTRALALSGLAVAAGDPARFAEAGEAFARARTVTSAVGVTTDSRRMLDGLTPLNPDGVAEIRAALNPAGDVA